MVQISETQRVADRVKGAIEHSGVTQAHIVKCSGIPRTTLARRLDGHSPFNVDELQRIASVLRMPLNELVYDEPRAS